MNQLYQDIQKFIKDSGGRIKLAYDIMIENPNCFTLEEKRNMKYRMSNIESAKRSKLKKPTMKTKGYYWTPEDVQFLLDNYGKMKTYRIKQILKRSSDSIKFQFSIHATREQKMALPQIFRTKLRNFKNLNT